MYVRNMNFLEVELLSHKDRTLEIVADLARMRFTVHITNNSCVNMDSSVAPHFALLEKTLSWSSASKEKHSSGVLQRITFKWG